MIFLPHPLPLTELLNWPALRIASQGAATQWLLPTELVYLSGEHNYSWLHCCDGRRLLVPRTLKRLQSQLPPLSFVRLHRSYVVNRQYVDRVETNLTGNHDLYLVSGIRLSVSRRSWVRVRQQLWLSRQSASERPTRVGSPAWCGVAPPYDAERIDYCLP